MELSLGTRILLFAILAAVIVIGMYYELRVLSGKREARREARAARDELYNLVATTEAIADALRNQGMALGEAETLAHRARMAYEARDAVKARSLAMQARQLLADSKERAQLPPEKEEFESLGEGDEEWEENPLPDDNTMPSRFLIGLARSDLESWDGDADPVMDLLDQADAAADAGDCDRALALANRARCIMRSGPCEETPRPRCCPGCFHNPGPGDRFCPRCGQPLE